MPDLDDNHVFTRREVFAAMAMQGLLASDLGPGSESESIALWAVRQADDLIKTLLLSAEQVEVLTDAS